MRGAAISEFFDRLADGDPVALGIVGFFVVLGIVAGIFILIVRRKMKQDDEAQAKKYGRKPPK
jgi:F0F1-type ATP synthase assembly protein I